jgi:glycosyltransferase involved in cell wall biosynthesis
MLAALALLKKEGHDFAYHIVGTGTIEAELKDMAADLGLSEQVIWHGFQPDVRAVLRRADVFLLPSHTEGLPNSLLEAMAEGLVCVSRNVGGTAEVWPEEASELFVPYAARPEDFARIMAGLLTAGDEQLRAVQQIFLDAARRNSREHMVQNLESFFEGVKNAA